MKGNPHTAAWDLKQLEYYQPTNDNPQAVRFKRVSKLTENLNDPKGKQEAAFNAVQGLLSYHSELTPQASLVYGSELVAQRHRIAG